MGVFFSYSPKDFLDAAKNGNIEKCKKILKRLKADNIDVNFSLHAGRTLLHWAARNGHTATCALLLGSGADPKAKDNDDYTPLHQAAWKGHTAICALLIGRGADPKAKSKCGCTPLHEAAGKGHTDICKLLIDKYGADPNAKDIDGVTPLLVAAGNGDTATRALLLDRGADPNAKDRDGNTLFDYATHNDHADTCAVLPHEANCISRRLASAEELTGTVPAPIADTRLASTEQLTGTVPTPILVGGALAAMGLLVALALRRFTRKRRPATTEIDLEAQN